MTGPMTKKIPVFAVGILIGCLSIGTVQGTDDTIAIEEEGSHGNEDTSFLAVTLANGFFTTTESAVQNITNVILNTVDFTVNSVVFLLSCVAILIDTLIRQPMNLVNILLYIVSWMIETLLFLFLDIILHAVLKEGLFHLLWFGSTLVNLILQTVCNSFIVVLYLSKTTVLIYLNITSYIFVYATLPFLEWLYWALSIVSFFVIALILFHFIVQLRQQNAPNERSSSHAIEGMVILPILYIVYDIWMTLCLGLFRFVCYPVLVCMYSFGTAYLTFISLRVLVDSLSNYLDYFRQNQFEVTSRNASRLVLDLKTRLLLILASTLSIFNPKTIKLPDFETMDSDEVNENECVICFEERQLVTLIPCQHNVMCRVCTIRVLEIDDRCPICRSTLQDYV